jgi:hypothetical protein
MKAVQLVLRALCSEDTGYRQAGAQGFREQVRTLDACQTAAVAAGVGQRSAQLLQANILLTLYNANRHLRGKPVFLQNPEFWLQDCVFKILYPGLFIRDFSFGISASEFWL